MLLSNKGMATHCSLYFGMDRWEWIQNFDQKAERQETTLEV
jgi:hypothetical protein